MKILSLLLAAATFATGAEVKTLWADGVSPQQGWYDFDKARDGSQSGLCWAICASNLIAWWQNTQAPETLPAQVPMGEAVWHTFRDSFSNDGSDPDQGLRWWFSGKYRPSQPATGEACATVTNTATGSYYKHCEGEGDGYLWALLYRGRGSQVTAQTMSSAFYEGFKRGHAFWVGVAYYRRNGRRYTHSLTVWGIDTEPQADGTPRIVAIYMTDSDDGTHCLHRIPLKEEAGMLKFDCPQHPLYGQIGDITITNYTGMKTSPF